LTPSDYSDFRLLANAIRTGQGHPIENPSSLIDILRGDTQKPITWE
jgi:hypothetical protein